MAKTPQAGFRNPFSQSYIEKRNIGLPCWLGPAKTWSRKMKEKVWTQGSDNKMNTMHCKGDYHVALVVRNLPANAEDTRDMGSIPGSWSSSGGGHGNLLQYSCLENPMDRGDRWATFHGVAKSWTWLKQLNKQAHTHCKVLSLMNSASNWSYYPSAGLLIDQNLVVWSRW